MEDLKEKLDELCEELCADSLKKGKSWNGYKVYIPQYKEMAYRGMPLVVLVKGDEARISTPMESLDYLDFERAEDKVAAKYTE